jgi:hypothetical protein
MPGPPQKHLDRKLLRARGISEDSRDHATHALVLSVGQAVPIDVGGRVTGRVGPFSLGTLNLESSDPALKNGGERYTSASASFAKSHTLSNRRIVAVRDSFQIHFSVLRAEREHGCTYLTPASPDRLTGGAEFSGQVGEERAQA